MLPPLGVSTDYRILTKFGRAGDLPNVITHAKFEINSYKNVTLAKFVEVSCFSTTPAGAINTTKPCRADMLSPSGVNTNCKRLYARLDRSIYNCQLNDYYA